MKISKRERRRRCPSGKLPFRDRTAALLAVESINRVSGQGLNNGGLKKVYRCGDCGSWHVSTRKK